MLSFSFTLFVRFLFLSYAYPRDIHSFPTRRSSDLFHKMDFQRKVGEQLQQYNLRPEIRRMVLLRHNQVEVPFSPDGPLQWRSEEHTSELQSLTNLVCRLLLEKKKHNNKLPTQIE